jgi:hypothetical protein
VSDRPYDTPNNDPLAPDLPADEPVYGTGSTSAAPPPRLDDYDTSERTRTDEAREQGRQVADTAKGEARSVAETAKGQAGRVADEAKAQGRNLVSEAKTQFKDQAQGQTDRAAGLANDLASQFRALSEGRTEDAGELQRYAQQATDQVERFAQRLNDRGFDGLVDDLSGFARRRPGVFLLGAAAAGFVTGRLVRGARDAQSDTSTTSTSTPIYPPAAESSYVVADVPEAPITSSRPMSEGF